MNILHETKLIAALFAAQDGKCFHCGDIMLRGELNGRSGKLRATREHVFPRSGSGSRLSNNFVLAHAQCNSAKGAREPTIEEIQKASTIYARIGLPPFKETTPEMVKSWNSRRRKVRDGFVSIGDLVEAELARQESGVA